MSIDLTGLVRPQLVEMTKRDDNPNVAEFRLQPLERGFGYTLGNSLRRLLLSSLPGSAVWGFRLDGVVHEHQTVQGVLEDVHQIIQRLKTLTLVLDDDVDEAVLRMIKHDGPGPVYARDIQEPGQARVVNPDHLLFTCRTIATSAASCTSISGRGYVEAEMHPADRSYPGRPGADRRHLQPGAARQFHRGRNPRRTAHRLRSPGRLGRDQRHLSPEDAVAYAAALAQEHFRYFVEFGAAQVPGGMPASAPRSGIGTGGQAGPLHRRSRPLGADAELAQELQHPHPCAIWSSSRSRTSRK